MAFETIREFFVSLTYGRDVDPQQKKLIEGIELSTTKAILFAEAVAKIAEKTVDAVRGTVEDAAKLGLFADRMRTAATEVVDLERAFARMGGSKADADQIIVSLHSAFADPGRAAQLAQMGVTSRDPVIAAQQLGDALNHHDLSTQAWLRSVAGISLLQAELLQKTAKLAELMKQEDASQAASGITAALIKEQEHFYDTLKQTEHNIGNIFAGALMQTSTGHLQAPLDQLNTWLIAHQTELTTSLAAIATDMADLAAALPGLSNKLTSSLNYLAGGQAGRDTTTALEKYAPWSIFLAPKHARDLYNQFFGPAEHGAGLSAPVPDLGSAVGDLETDGGRVSTSNPLPIVVPTAGNASPWGSIGRFFGFGGPQAADDAARPRMTSPPGAGLSAPAPGPQASVTSSDYHDLKFNSAENFAGGGANPATIALAEDLQHNDPQAGNITALNDAWHHYNAPTSDHTRGDALDILMRDRDYEAARQRERQRLTSLGLVEGRNADFWIEPGTGDHMHISIGRGAGASDHIRHALGVGAPERGADVSVEYHPTVAVSIKGVKDPKAAAALVADQLTDTQKHTRKFFENSGVWDR